MKPDPAQVLRSRRTGEAIRYRDRNRGKLRAVTAAAGLASVLTAAGVGYTLPGSPGSTHTAASRVTSGSGSASSSVGTSSSSGSSSSNSANSSSARSSSSSSNRGLQSSSAPSASTGSPQVTSGGS